MNVSRETSGAKVRPSSRWRLLVVVLVVAGAMALLASSGNTRSHAAVPPPPETASPDQAREPVPQNRSNQFAPGDSLVKAGQKTESAQVIVHGSLSGNLKPTDPAPWRNWLQ